MSDARVVLIGVGPDRASRWASALRDAGFGVLAVAAPWEIEGVPRDAVILEGSHEVGRAFLQGDDAVARPAPTLLVARPRSSRDTGPGRALLSPEASAQDALAAVRDCLADEAGAARLELRGGRVDLVAATFTPPGRDPAALSPTEVALLIALHRAGGEPLGRDLLLREAWGHASPAPSRAVDTAVRRLRARIEVDPAAPDHLVTVRGVGYALVGVRALAAGPDVGSPWAPPHPLRGRDADVDRLRAAIAQSHLVTVCGPVGCGKSALARAVLAEVDGARRGAPDALDAGGGLLFLDDVDPDALAPRLALWLAERPDRRAVVTCRGPLRVAGEAVVWLDALDRAAASRLLRDRLGARGDEVDEALPDLAEAVDCLPLALEWLAGRLRLLDPQDVLTRLRADPLALLRDPLRRGAHASLEGLLSEGALGLDAAARADALALAKGAAAARPAVLVDRGLLVRRGGALVLPAVLAAGLLALPEPDPVP